MGPDPRIAEFIGANRRRLTREAIDAQLREAGYEPDAIAATWAALDTPDADDEVGEGFWGRFWIYLVGMNVAAFLLVSLLTGLVPNGVGLAAILGIVLALGAAISLALVAATHPTRLGRGTALAVGGIIPLVFTFLIGGACYALVGAVGPPPPPPLSGTLMVSTGPPLGIEGTAAAFCQAPPEGEDYFSVYTESQFGPSDGGISLSVNVFPEGPGGALVPSLGMSVGGGGDGGDGFTEYQPGPDARVELEEGSTVQAGSLSFEGLIPFRVTAEGQLEEPPGGAEPVSGMVSWSCEE